MGDSEFVVVDGKLRIRKLDAERKTTETVWLRPELEQNVLVRFHAKPTEPAEGNAANLNLFLHACEKDGSALKFGRSGSYQLYHEVPNYIFTLTGGIRSDWSRARRDPGFQLLHEADVRSDVGTQYEIVVTCVERRLGAGAVRQVPDRGPIGLGPAVDRGQRVGLPRGMPLDPQAGP